MQWRASSSSVIAIGEPPLPAMSGVFLHNLIQSSILQPGPRLPLLFDFAGAEIDLFNIGERGGPKEGANRDNVEGGDGVTLLAGLLSDIDKRDIAGAADIVIAGL